MKRFVVFLINMFGPSWGILLIAILFYSSSPFRIIEEWVKTQDKNATFKNIAISYFTEKNALIRGEIDNLTI